MLDIIQINHLLVAFIILTGSILNICGSRLSQTKLDWHSKAHSERYGLCVAGLLTASGAAILPELQFTLQETELYTVLEAFTFLIGLSCAVAVIQMIVGGIKCIGGPRVLMRSGKTWN